MAYENMQFDWAPAMERQSDPSFWNVLSHTPWAGTSFNPNASGEWSPTGEYIPAGYDLGFNKLNYVGTWALRDPSGKIVNSYQGAARDSLNSSDYALMATMATLGTGLAGGFGALGGGAGSGAVDAYGAGSGWGADTLSAMGQGVGAGETAGLGAAQVGALNGGGGTGVASLGSSELASVPQMANFTSSLPEMATMSNASIAGNGAGGLFGLSGNTLANLGQMGVGLLAQNRTTNALTDSNNAQLGLQRDMYNQNRADNQPLLDLRNQTLPQINALMQNPSSITSDPGYQFGLKQGQSQIDNSAAARGGYYSGAQLKASQRYGQDYAGTKLDQSLNRLMGVAGLGQVGGTNNQNNNNNFSQQQGNSLMNGGDIRGSGYMGMANTIGTGIGGIFNDKQQNYWNQRNPFGGPGS